MSVRVTVKNKILRITFLVDSKQFPTLSRLSRFLYMGFRATLSSQSFKVSGYFITWPKVTSYPVYQNLIISKKFAEPSASADDPCLDLDYSVYHKNQI